ncbi:MAG: hypothetical protein JSU00_26395 [Acidobacteria bacterium]|nr:hypothetical protein [Acidobacteriota bacterium]
MRVYSLLMLGVAVAALAAGQRLIPVSRTTAEHMAAVSPQASTYNGPRAKLAMWIWSDKYTYQPGQAVTLKWTIKTNGDLYPYTVFVYRQNNQTGKKTFLPGGGEDATDINGNTADKGFQPMQLADGSKAVLAGAGGKFAAITAPSEYGMHTLVVQLRDYTGTHVVKSSYMKIGVVKGVTTISSEITGDRTLTNDIEWHLKGVIYVKNNATLTVEPGTFVIGEPGTTPPSALIVTTSGKIMASGTKARPIIMTSSLPFGQRSRGDWGGLVMLGKAPINVGGNIPGGTGICPAEGCKNAPGTFYIEGLVGNPDSVYGGTDPKHNCGTLRYVRVEFAGTILSPNNELNSFTWGGCGSDTVAEHLQAIYGKDDSFEWFGGTMDAKWLVGGLGADDYTDYQLGWTGRLQFGLMYQSPDSPGNRGLEGDNSEYDQAGTPYSNPTMFNVTYVGSGIPGYDESNAPGLFLRRGSRGSFNNMVVSNFYSPCFDINDANTQAQADAGNLKMNGVLCWSNNIGTKGANTITGQIQSSASSSAYNLAYAQGQKGNGAGKNILVADPLFTRPFEYSDPDWTGLFSSPIFRAGWVQPPDDGFFDQTARFIGGIGDEDWTEEWTFWVLETELN